jgi:alpha-1,6-mannosyltransferase
VHPVTPYAPGWTDVEALVADAVASVSARLLAFKMLGAGAMLASGALVWAILGRVHPEHRFAGTLALLWNPMILAEAVGDAHNDGLMLWLVLAALWLTFRRPLAGWVGMVAAALTKYVPLLFLPPQVIYGWTASADTRRFARRAAAATLAAAAIVVAAFGPWWLGGRTFSGVRESAGAVGTASTASLAREALGRVGVRGAEPLVAAASALVLVATVAAVSLQVRDEPRLVRACAWISVVYLLTAPTYWPWYAVLPVGLAALVPDRPFRLIVVALSLGARLAAPWDVLFVRGVVGRGAFLLLTWATGIGLTVAALATTSFRRTRPAGPQEWAETAPTRDGDAPD